MMPFFFTSVLGIFCSETVFCLFLLFLRYGWKKSPISIEEMSLLNLCKFCFWFPTSILVWTTRGWLYSVRRWLFAFSLSQQGLSSGPFLFFSDGLSFVLKGAWSSSSVDSSLSVWGSQSHTDNSKSHKMESWELALAKWPSLTEVIENPMVKSSWKNYPLGGHLAPLEKIAKSTVRKITYS